MSKKLKLSQWHDGSVKPVHVGFYERESGFFNYWTGKYWCWGVNTLTRIYSYHFKDKHPMQNLEWRGIVK